MGVACKQQARELPQFRSKCARSQVRPFHEDDEAAHERVTEHMKKLGERMLQDGDFPYEDITGQDEPPVDSPPRSTATRHTGPSGERSMEVEPDVQRRMREKTRTVSTDQPTVPPSIATTDTARQETVGDHDDKRRRVDEPETPLSPVVQNEAPVLNPCHLIWTRKMMRSLQMFRCLRSQPEVSGDQLQGWTTEEALFTVSPGEGNKNEPVDTWRKT